MSTTPFESMPRLTVRMVAAQVASGPDVGRVQEARGEILTVGTAKDNDLVLSDPAVSRYHLELSRGEGGVHVTDLGSTNGTVVGSIRIERGTVPVGVEVKVGASVLRVLDGSESTVSVHPEDQVGDLVGATPVMRRLMAAVERASASTVPVLVVGESGTGKELVARALHQLSARSAGPFVTVDCGALTPSLVASELFGHERGSFTGAERQHLGAFERADGGTLFLDEVGELPLELQPQLLGALERRSFRRVGGKSDLSVDVRLVCATNRDLRVEVNRGRFRLDLYYRMAVVTLRMPPLRDRPSDIPLLVEHFAHECGHAGPIDSLTPSVVAASLASHSWPGNVRELRNWVEATLAMGEPPGLGGSESPRLEGSAEIVGEEQVESPLGPYKAARAATLHDFERGYLPRLLSEAKGNVARAARLAKMDRTYLIKLLQRHGMR